MEPHSSPLFKLKMVSHPDPKVGGSPALSTPRWHFVPEHEIQNGLPPDSPGGQWHPSGTSGPIQTALVPWVQYNTYFADKDHTHGVSLLFTPGC